ncbi:MAG TPA: type 4a pilus biogenesis protein PilO [Planctomycetaceae bacterium]|jgi:Tfp pilus assembly protein PilO|nr:type 4a pilus biogenesis protein PilO [Planctomycetaceae bacterium]
MSQPASSSLRVFDLGLHAGGLGVVLVIVYGAWVFAIEPLQQQHAGLAQRIHDERRVQSQGDDILRRHREVEKQVANYEASFAHALTRLPETPRESEFLAQITHLARTCQLKIQRYHPREPVNEGTHTALEVQLDATADYAGVCQFLDGLRGLTRLCRVTRLRIHTVESDGTNLPVEMMLRIYYAPLSKHDVQEARHG